MIITQTPLRISFLGGGTDYPEYFREHGGETLATAINKYSTVTIHPLTQFVDYTLRVHYSRLESVSAIDAIEHSGARECLRFFGIENGVEVYYAADLPARTGLGSSSSAVVGLLHALHAMKRERVTGKKLAEEAIRMEREIIGERVGSQDQYICALGGFRHMQFLPDGSVRATPLKIKPQRLAMLQEHLLLLYTSRQRNAHEVLEEQVERTKSGRNNETLSRMRNLVPQGIKILKGTNDLSEFGSLLHEGWELKRQLSTKVSTEWIDHHYHEARKAGAVGGKLLGAGSGGFLLLFVEPEKRAQVKKALADLPEAPFAFEQKGSRLIFSDVRTA